MSYLSFDATNVPTDNPMEAIPAGDYSVVVIDSEVKNSKSGGSYLELTMQVLDGPYQNRLIWDRITLANDNSKAVEIGQRQLSQVCHAVGVLQVRDSAQLHNVPIIARVKYKVDPQYGPKNEAGGYRSLSAATTPAAPSTPLPQAHAAAPWNKPQSAAAPPVSAEPTAGHQAQPAVGQTPPWATRAA